jgi:hypothetical protein
MTSTDAQDFNYFRGNKFQKYYKNSSGEYERDSMGRLKKTDISDEEVKNRSNYQKNDVINYLDGDSTSGVYYGYGVSSLINDKSRVIKGGSWNDRPYWYHLDHAVSCNKTRVPAPLDSVALKLILDHLKDPASRKEIFLASVSKTAVRRNNYSTYILRTLSDGRVLFMKNNPRFQIGCKIRSLNS